MLVGVTWTGWWWSSFSCPFSFALFFQNNAKFCEERIVAIAYFFATPNLLRHIMTCDVWHWFDSGLAAHHTLPSYSTNEVSRAILLSDTLVLVAFQMFEETHIKQITANFPYTFCKILPAKVILPPKEASNSLAKKNKKQEEEARMHH